MASLRHLGGDRWQVTVFAGRDGEGRQQRITKVIRADGIKAANRAMAKAEVDLRARIGAPARSHGGRTVAWLCDEWAAHRAAQPSSSPYTLHRQKGVLARIKKGLGKVPLDELSPLHVERFYASLRRAGVSESTVHHHHRVLKAVIRQGDRWGLADASVMSRVTAPQPRRRLISPPSPDVVTGLLAAAPGDLAVILRLYAATGARRSELLGAQWADLDGTVLTLQRVVVDVPGRPIFTKDSMKHPDEPPRRLPLDADTLNLLAAYRVRLEAGLADLGYALAGATFMFPDLRRDPSGMTPRRPDRITQLFRELCASQGVKVRLHDLRHWHATQLMAAGVPVAAIAERLGHAQTSTTLNVYAHTTRSMDEMAADIIGKLLA